MKKLLSIIGAITITSTGALTLVSCNNSVTPPKNEDQDISFETLMTTKTNIIFNGSVNLINTEDQLEQTFDPKTEPIDLNVPLFNFLTNFWNENRWVQDFLSKPNQTIILDQDISFEFKNFEIKKEYKTQKQIILDSTFDEEYQTITHGDDKYTKPNQ